MWYVIQTMAGREEELASLIRQRVDGGLYGRCFVVLAEGMKRLGGGWRVQVRPLFPGYVFLDTEQPEEVFFGLKKLPRFGRILGGEKGEFSPVEEEEREFLELLMGEGDLVRPSLVEAGEDGQIVRIEGSLGKLRERILAVNLHKRYAVVQVSLAGREQTVRLGIRLGKDEKREGRRGDNGSVSVKGKTKEVSPD